MKIKIAIGGLLIYIGSGLVYGKYFWVGTPLTLIGALLLSSVSWNIEKQQNNDGF